MLGDLGFVDSINLLPADKLFLVNGFPNLNLIVQADKLYLNDLGLNILQCALFMACQ